MPSVDVEQDFEACTIVMTAHYDTSADDVWSLWADPRRLERWWGPPGYPATVQEHDLAPGGRVSYFMTGPDGERFPGAWKVTSVDAPSQLIVVDEFIAENGEVVAELPATRLTVDIVSAPDGTTMILTSTFASAEAMQQILDLGAIEGMVAAMSQIDAILIPEG
jgi:uncharacterized protein YndB with AHSA1/START domain